MSMLSNYRKDQPRLIDGASTAGQQPPRVSINGNQFALIDPSGTRTMVPNRPEGAALDVIFVDRNEKMCKLFWGEGKTYNPSELSPPICWSDNGVAPSVQAQDPQSPTCASCKWNVIGSTISPISGAKIKACGDLKKFAVVVQGFPGAYQFTIKPGSFKAWNNYTSYLQMQKLQDGGRPDLSDVVTRIKFVGQGIMDFTAIELVTDEHAMAQQVIDVWERNKQSDLTGMMVGRYDQPVQGVLAAPQQDPSAPKAAVPPPQAQGQSLFFQPQKEEVGKEAFWDKPVTPAAAAPAAKPPARKKREEQPAPIQPAQPVPQHGMAQANTPPADIGSRLDNLFKLPPVK